MSRRKEGPTGINITVKDDKGTRNVGTGSGKKVGDGAYAGQARTKKKKTPTKAKEKTNVYGLGTEKNRIASNKRGAKVFQDLLAKRK